jgi:hypothetical protein
MSRRKPFVMPRLETKAAPEPSSENEAQIQALVVDIHRQLGHPLDRPPTLLSEAEVAQVLHMRPSALQRWRYARTQPGLSWRKVGAAVLYWPRDVAAYILSSTEGTPT